MDSDGIREGSVIMPVKLGSLFDGIGGTPLSAVMAGAEPVWASEIEKWPISITKRHFPNMKHYGDITHINGAEIEPVDIIVGGSPCQDLSVAGKRAGLEGARSGLFMDQVRIVKEMRNATSKQIGNESDELPRPRYMVWENVPGAFSSNKGEDFRVVLEEVCKVCDPEARVPGPPKGKWLRSGTIMGDGYSISWRTVDAQYWGVPQRRRRIYLVADFGGSSTPEICFERESVSGDITEGGEARQGVAEDTERSSGATGAYGVVSKGNGEAFLMEEKHMSLSCGGGQAGQGYPATLVLNDQGGSVMGVSYGVTGTLRAETHGHQPIVLDSQAAVCYGISSFASNAMKSSNPHSGVYVADTSRTIDQNGGNPACNQGGVAVVEPYLVEMTSTKNTVVSDGICPTLTARMDTGGNQVNAVCYGLAEPPQYIVRRLTPLECERLQGYPDGWTQFDDDGKEISDTQRYKALGNSFAVPNAYFFISRCVKQLRIKMTLEEKIKNLEE